jgi:hypothetical protein
VATAVNNLHIDALFFFTQLVSILEVDCLPLFLFYGTSICAIGQGKLA